MILGILRQISVLSGIGNGADDRGPLLRSQPLKLLLEPCVPFGSHRKFLDQRSVLFCRIQTAADFDRLRQVQDYDRSKAVLSRRGGVRQNFIKME
jgi:hypothetical protein